MKMKRIANNVALQTIGYVISGFTNVYIYILRDQPRELAGTRGAEAEV